MVKDGNSIFEDVLLHNNIICVTKRQLICFKIFPNPENALRASVFEDLSYLKSKKPPSIKTG